MFIFEVYVFSLKLLVATFSEYNKKALVKTITSSMLNRNVLTNTLLNLKPYVNFFIEDFILSPYSALFKNI